MHSNATATNLQLSSFQTSGEELPPPTTSTKSHIEGVTCAPPQPSSVNAIAPTAPQYGSAVQVPRVHLHSFDPASCTQLLPANIDLARMKPPAPVGGDLSDCLSSDDIDDAMRALLGSHFISARATYDTLLAGAPDHLVSDIHKLINNSVLARGFAVLPIHIQHHWVAALFCADQQGPILFDSAPSSVVRQELVKVFQVLRLHPANYVTAFQQRRRSNECGLFVILIALWAACGNIQTLKDTDANPKEKPPVISLAPWRTALRRHATGITGKELLSLLPDQARLVILPECATNRSNALVNNRIKSVCSTCGSRPCECDELLLGQEVLYNAAVPRQLSFGEQVKAMQHLQVGDTISVSWASMNPRGGFLLYTWIGRATKLLSTRRRWEITALTSPHSQLYADDGSTPTKEVFHLPCQPTDQLWITGIDCAQPVIKGSGPRACPYCGDSLGRAQQCRNVLCTRDHYIDATEEQRIPSDQEDSSDDEGEREETRARRAATERLIRQYTTYLGDPGEFDDPENDLVPPDEIPDANPGHLSVGDLRKHAPKGTYEEAAGKAVMALPWRAVTDASRRRHWQAIQSLVKFAADAGIQDSKALDPVIALHIRHLRSHPSRAVADRQGQQPNTLSYKTLERALGSLIGALAALPFYSLGAPSFFVGNLPFCRASMRTLLREGIGEGVRKIVDATTADVRKAVAREASQAVKAMILLCWLTAARPGDVINLKRKNVALDGINLKVQFQQAKTIIATGEYVINSAIHNEEWRAILEGFIAENSSSPSTYLFPMGNAQQRTAFVASVRFALRAVNPNLEIRSMRRGTLVALANAGASEEQLLTFSRHTSLKTLRRYLGFGAVMSAEAASAKVIASVLSGGAPRVRHPLAEEIDARIEEDNGECCAFPVIRKFDVPPHLPDELKCSFEVARITLAPWLSVVKMADGTSRMLVSTEKAPGVQDRSNVKNLPPHAKESTREPIKVERFASLPILDETLRKRWEDTVKRVLTDDTGNYSQVPWDGKLENVRITPKQLQILLRHGKLRKLRPDEKPLGTVIFFLIPEVEKQRARVITWTKIYNAFHAKTALGPCKNVTKRQTRRMACKKFAICLDMAGYFDQFLLAQAVQLHQCADAGEEGIVCNTRLGMGQFDATHAASECTEGLCSFPMRGDTEVEQVTDNVRFTGSDKEAVIDAAWEFVQRCKHVEAKLNEVDVFSATRETVAALLKTTSDFMGEITDFEEHTIACRQKHFEKLRKFMSVCSNNTKPTFCEVLGFYAMLLYVSETYGVRGYRFPRVKEFCSNLASTLANEPQRWKTQCTDPRPAEMYAWANLLLEATPAKVIQRPQLGGVAQIDASSEGYAAVISVLTDGRWKTTLLQHKWEQTRPGAFKHSTFAEPEALTRTVMHLVTEHPAVNFLLLSDHSGFVDAYRAGYSPSPNYNKRIATVHRLRPFYEIQHRSGDLMLADKYSRMGKFRIFSLTPSDVEEAQKVAAEEVRRRNAGRVVGPVEEAGFFVLAE